MSCSLRDIQLKELDILLEFDRICRENDIKYYLAQGSLLGAMRHKGFIPWDDDIDIIIDYKELEKLSRIYKEKVQKNYSLLNYKNEKYNPLSWSKIRADGTVSRPRKYKDLPIHWGICIDLFQIYPVSNNKAVRAVELFVFKVARKMLLAGMTQFEDNHGLFTRMFEYVPICLRHSAMRFSEWLFSLHKEDTEYVLPVCKGAKIVKRSLIFDGKSEVEFEGYTFPAPADYHQYLTVMYGDYMTPPPADEQKGHDLTLGDIEFALEENE